MLLKPSMAEHCDKCNRIIACSEEVYGCDYCQKEFGDYGIRDLTLFPTGEESQQCDFCSWHCLFLYFHQTVMPQMKQKDMFVTLPFINAEDVQSFWDAIQSTGAIR